MQSQIRETNNVAEDSQRDMELPIQAGRQGVQRNNRLGRHKTKHEGRSRPGIETPPGVAEGRRPSRPIQVREFNEAARSFLEWVKMEYRAPPNSSRRISTSLTSAKEFLGREPVSLISPGRLEEYKAWRVNDHGVRDVTLRHDLHALSKFFGYVVKHRWAVDNPVRNVTIPSDADAIRIHVLTCEEEREYFLRAAKHRDLNDLGRLIINQGMRPDEVTCLRKADVDLDRWQLLITSGKSPAAAALLT
jgi:hypothetical protein